MNKVIQLLLLLTFSVSAAAQGQRSNPVDTVVLRPDSTFESKIHRLLYDKRTNVKYHLEQRGRIREVIVYFAEVEVLATGQKLYGARIDQRGNRNLFTDAPSVNAEYIDEDELDMVIGYLKKIRNEHMANFDGSRYTEYRYYTRAGIMFECYTGMNRMRLLIHYEINGRPADSYLNNPGLVAELIESLEEVATQIKEIRSNKR
jgi:hypothetical protein